MTGDGRGVAQPLLDSRGSVEPAKNEGVHAKTLGTHTEVMAYVAKTKGAIGYGPIVHLNAGRTDDHLARVDNAMGK